MTPKDLNLLRLFETIESHGSITGAAHELNLSQPAVSHALRRLREQLDDPLFVRRGNVMVPTPKTSEIIGPVRRALQDIARAVDKARAFDPATSQRKFTVGLLPVAETGLIAPIAAAMRREAPGIAIDFVRVDHKAMETDLAANRLDLAIDVVLPAPPVVFRERAWADRFVLVAAKDHPGAEAGGIDREAYLAAGHVVVSSRRRGAGLVDLAIQKNGLRRKVFFRCQSHQAAAEIVADSDLLLTVPASAAAGMAVRKDLEFHLPPLELPHSELFIYWHENWDTDPANAWLRDRLRFGFERRWTVIKRSLPEWFFD